MLHELDENGDGDVSKVMHYTHCTHHTHYLFLGGVRRVDGAAGPGYRQ
jgi:hypothetical protein